MEALLPAERKAAVVELVPYLTGGFGNATRIDYGSGWLGQGDVWGRGQVGRGRGDIAPLTRARICPVHRPRAVLCGLPALPGCRRGPRGG